MNESINMDKILTEIKKNSSQRIYHQIPLEFDDICLSIPASQNNNISYDLDLLDKEFHYLNYNWKNSLYLSSRQSGVIAQGIKNIIVKCLAFIMVPIIDFQNAYNSSNAKCIDEMRRYILELEVYKRKVVELEEEVKQLRGIK